MNLFKAGLSYLRGLFKQEEETKTTGMAPQFKPADTTTAQSTPAFIAPESKAPELPEKPLTIGPKTPSREVDVLPGPRKEFSFADAIARGDKPTVTPTPQKPPISKVAIEEQASKQGVQIFKKPEEPKDSIFKREPVRANDVMPSDVILAFPKLAKSVVQKYIKPLVEPTEDDIQYAESHGGFTKYGDMLVKLPSGEYSAVDTLGAVGAMENVSKGIIKKIAKTNIIEEISENLLELGIRNEDLAAKLIKANDEKAVRSLVDQYIIDQAKAERSLLYKFNGKVPEIYGEYAEAFGSTRSDIFKNTYTEKASNLVDVEKNLDINRVKEYEDAIKRGDDVGPIAVNEKGNIVEDGKHRLQAYRNLGIEDVNVVKIDEDAKKIIPKQLWDKGGIESAWENAVNINISKYDLNDEGKESLRLLINRNKDKIIGDITPAKISDLVEQARKEQDVIFRNMDDADINKNLINEARVRNRSNTLQEIIENPATSASDKARAVQEQIEVLREIKNYNTEWGRAGLMKQQKSKADRTVAEEILDRISKTGAKADDVAKRAADVDWNNADEVNDFYREFVKPTKTEIWDEYRYNNMLSSPKTQLRNVVSNLWQTTVMRPATEVMTSAINAVTDIMSGKPVDAIKHLGETVSSPARYYYNMLASLPNAFKQFSKGFSGFDSIAKPDLETISRSTGKFPEAFKLPSKFMEGMDKFFSTLISEGHKSVLLSKGFSEELAEKEARKMAEYSIFRAPLDPKNKSGQGALLSVIDDITSWLNRGKDIPVAGKALGIFLPFLRTPMNFAKQWLEYSPLGIATLPGAKNKQEQLAKMAIGSMVSLMGYQLAMSDRTTWGVPADKEAQKAFFAAGKIPYSFTVTVDGKDRNIPITYLGPLAFSVALPASIKYYQKDNPKALTDNEMEKIAKGLGGSLELLGQQTFLENIGNVIDLMRGDSSAGWDKTLAFASSQAIPLSGLLRWTSTIVDDTYRQADGYKEEFQRMIPYWSKELKPHTDPTGEPSKRDLINSFLPYDVKTSKTEFDALLKQREEQIRSSNYVAQEIDSDLAERAIDIMTEMRGAKTQEEGNMIMQKLQTDPRLFDATVRLIEKQASYMEALVEPLRVYKDKPKALAEVLYTKISLAENEDEAEEVQELITKLKEEGILTGKVFDHLQSIIEGKGYTDLLENLVKEQKGEIEELSVPQEEEGFSLE